MWSFFIFIIMEDEYTEFLIDLLENRIRALRLKLDRSKYPVYEDEKLTTAEVATIEAEIKHWKLQLKLTKINNDF
jgi:hypothetical protein